MRVAKIDVGTSTSAIYGFEVLIAFGAGSFVQAGFAVIQTIVSPAEMSYGITFMLVGTFGEESLARGSLPLPDKLLTVESLISSTERPDTWSLDRWSRFSEPCSE